MKHPAYLLSRLGRKACISHASRIMLSNRFFSVFELPLSDGTDGHQLLIDSMMKAAISIPSFLGT